MDIYYEYLNRVRSDISSTRDENISQNEKTDIHKKHCDKCFNLNACKKLVKTTQRHCYPHRQKNKESADFSGSSNDNVIITCPIIICPHGCLHRFHKCKADEHELLCPRVKVPCINENNGCPFVIERRLRGIHLEVCPARYFS